MLFIDICTSQGYSSQILEFLRNQSLQVFAIRLRLNQSLGSALNSPMATKSNKSILDETTYKNHFSLRLFLFSLLELTRIESDNVSEIQDVLFPYLSDVQFVLIPTTNGDHDAYNDNSFVNLASPDLIQQAISTGAEVSVSRGDASHQSRIEVIYTPVHVSSTSSIEGIIEFSFLQPSVVSTSKYTNISDWMKLDTLNKSTVVEIFRFILESTSAVAVSKLQHDYRSPNHESSKLLFSSPVALKSSSLSTVTSPPIEKEILPHYYYNNNMLLTTELISWIDKKLKSPMPIDIPLWLSHLKSITGEVSKYLSESLRTDCCLLFLNEDNDNDASFSGVPYLYRSDSQSKKKSSPVSVSLDDLHQQSFGKVATVVKHGKAMLHKSNRKVFRIIYPFQIVTDSAVEVMCWVVLESNRRLTETEDVKCLDRCCEIIKFGLKFMFHELIIDDLRNVLLTNQESIRIQNSSITSNDRLIRGLIQQTDLLQRFISSDSNQTYDNITRGFLSMIHNITGVKISSCSIILGSATRETSQAEFQYPQSNDAPLMCIDDVIDTKLRSEIVKCLADEIEVFLLGYSLSTETNTIENNKSTSKQQSVHGVLMLPLRIASDIRSDGNKCNKVVILNIPDTGSWGALKSAFRGDLDYSSDVQRMNIIVEADEFRISDYHQNRMLRELIRQFAVNYCNCIETCRVIMNCDAQTQSSRYFRYSVNLFSNEL